MPGSHNPLPVITPFFIVIAPFLIVIASRRRGNLRKAKLKNQKAKTSQKSKGKNKEGFLHFNLSF